MKSRIVFSAAAFAFGLTLAACSSSGSSGSSGSSSRDNQSHAGSATVMKASNSQFGSILADTRGATLYTLTADGKAVACTSTACTAEWPPYFLPSGTTTPTGASGLGSVQAGLTLGALASGGSLNRRRNGGAEKEPARRRRSQG